MKCLAPWKALSVRFNGDVVPDCVYVGRHGNLHEMSLPEILNHAGLKKTQQSILQGILPEECVSCIKKEKIIGHSRRIFFDQVLHDTPRTTDIDIRFLEVNISNICNLKCVMCGGVNSTAWVKEDYKLHEISSDFRRQLDHPDFGYRIVKPDIIDKLFEYPEYFKNLQHVNIKGGEPYMEKDNIKLLQRLIDLNLNKQVELDISTNGTVPNDEFEELALQFKTKWHISIEAVGKLYEYIRGGKQYSFEQFYDNIHNFDKFDRVILAGTVLAYNVCHIQEVYDTFPDHEIYFTNVVAEPSYLSPTVLNDEVLKDTNFKHDSTLDDQVDVFVRYTKAIDELRGTDVLEVCPELRSYFS